MRVGQEPKKKLTDLRRSIGIDQFFFRCPIRQKEQNLLRADRVQNENDSHLETEGEGQAPLGAGGHICIDKRSQMRNNFRTVSFTYYVT